MNKENCALKLVNEISLYYDARSKKNIKFYYSVGLTIVSSLPYKAKFLQHFFSFHLLSKNLETKMFNSLILSVAVNSCGTLMCKKIVSFVCLKTGCFRQYL